MPRQKYFWIIWVNCSPRGDGSYRIVNWGKYKNQAEAERKANQLAKSDRVKDITIYHERTGKTIIPKGKSVFEI